MSSVAFGETSKHAGILSTVHASVHAHMHSAPVGYLHSGGGVTLCRFWQFKLRKLVFLSRQQKTAASFKSNQSPENSCLKLDDVNIFLKRSTSWIRSSCLDASFMFRAYTFGIVLAKSEGKKESGLSKLTFFQNFTEL